MRKLFRIIGWTLCVLFVLAVSAVGVARVIAGRKYNKQWTTHSVSFPIPFPLSAAEVETLRNERVAAFQDGFTGLIRRLVVTALQRHELPHDENPDALAFELGGMILAANATFVLHEDPAALDMAKQIVRRRLHVGRTVA